MTVQASSVPAKWLSLPLVTGVCVYAGLLALGNRMLAEDRKSVV